MGCNPFCPLLTDIMLKKGRFLSYNRRLSFVIYERFLKNELYVPEIMLCLRPALTVESVCFAPPDSISTSLSAEVLKCDVRMFTLNLTSSNSLSGDISVT